MSDRLLFNANFGEIEWSGTLKKKANLPSSSLVIPDPLLEASNYYFDIDGTIYECTGVFDTASYTTFKYDVEGTNVLYVRLVKASDMVEVAITPASFPEVSFETSVLKLYEIEPVLTGDYRGIVRFNKWKAVEVIYDSASDRFTYNLITDGDIPETENKYIKKALIRFTNTKAILITYNENNNNVEIEEVE